jgi:hypothetical protein
VILELPVFSTIEWSENKVYETEVAIQSADIKISLNRSPLPSWEAAGKGGKINK